MPKTWMPLLLLAVCPAVWADPDLGHAQSPPPDWVRRPPADDADLKFYVGRSPPLPSEAEAYAVASRNASESAIRENFGFETELSIDTYDGNASATSVLRAREESQKIRLTGFKFEAMHVEQKPGGLTAVSVLYSIPKSEIAAEKKRLKSATRPKKREFSVSGTPTPHSTTLEITTEPPGATVIIDGEPMGRTPLRIHGQLAPAAHALTLESDSHESIQEDFVLTPASTQRISKTLTPATGELTVATDPDNAYVTVNGRPLKGGTGRFTAGEPLTIAASHPATETVTHTLTLSRGERRELPLTLPKRPGFLSISSKPGEASIWINDIYVAETGSQAARQIRIAPGTVTIELRKSGYENHTESVIVRPGERVVMPTRTLSETSYQSTATPDLEPATENTGRSALTEWFRSLDSPFRWGFTVGIMGPTTTGRTPDLETLWRFAFSGEQVIGGITGFQFEGAFLVGSGSESWNGVYWGVDANVGVPVYLTGFRSSGFSLSATGLFGFTRYGNDAAKIAHFYAGGRLRAEFPNQTRGRLLIEGGVQKNLVFDGQLSGYGGVGWIGP